MLSSKCRGGGRLTRPGCGGVEVQRRRIDAAWLTSLLGAVKARGPSRTAAQVLAASFISSGDVQCRSPLALSSLASRVLAKTARSSRTRVPEIIRASEGRPVGLRGTRQK